MHEIAEAAGLSRPALHYHFKNKEEPLGNLVEDVTVRVQREATRIVEAAGGSNHRETLATMMRAQALWILRHPQHFAVVQRDEASLPDHLGAIQDTAKRDLLDRFRQVIATGTQAGQFRQVGPTMCRLRWRRSRRPAAWTDASTSRTGCTCRPWCSPMAT